MPERGTLRVHRRGYIRKGTRIPAATYLTLDAGKVGRTPKAQRFATFRGHIDGYHTSLPEEERRKSIREGIASNGALRTWRQLDQSSKLLKRTNPFASKTALADRNWVNQHYIEELHRARIRER